LHKASFFFSQKTFIFTLNKLIVMGKKRERKIKATKEGRLYIRTKDLLKEEKVRQTIAKLLNSDLIRNIEKSNNSEPIM